MEFCKDEACGKCLPGREGTKQMLLILSRISAGEGSLEDIRKLETLSEVIQKTALCALCRTAVNPVLSTLRYFRDEYEAAVKTKVGMGGIRMILTEALPYDEIVKNLDKEDVICVMGCSLLCQGSRDRGEKNR